MSFEAVTDFMVKYLTGVVHLVTIAEKAAMAFTAVARQLEKIMHPNITRTWIKG